MKSTTRGPTRHPRAGEVCCGAASPAYSIVMSTKEQFISANNSFERHVKIDEPCVFAFAFEVADGGSLEFSVLLRSAKIGKDDPLAAGVKLQPAPRSGLLPGTDSRGSREWLQPSRFRRVRAQPSATRSSAGSRRSDPPKRLPRRPPQHQRRHQLPSQRPRLTPSTRAGAGRASRPRMATRLAAHASIARAADEEFSARPLADRSNLEAAKLDGAASSSRCRLRALCGGIGCRVRTPRGRHEGARAVAPFRDALARAAPPRGYPRGLRARSSNDVLASTRHPQGGPHTAGSRPGDRQAASRSSARCSPTRSAGSSRPLDRDGARRAAYPAAGRSGGGR